MAPSEETTDHVSHVPGYDLGLWLSAGIILGAGISAGTHLASSAVPGEAVALTAGIALAAVYTWNKWQKGGFEDAG